MNKLEELGGRLMEGDETALVELRDPRIKREIERDASIRRRANSIGAYIDRNYDIMREAYGDSYVGIVLNVFSRERADCVIVGSSTRKAEIDKRMNQFRYHYRTVVDLRSNRRWEIK